MVNDLFVCVLFLLRQFLRFFYFVFLCLTHRGIWVFFLWLMGRVEKEQIEVRAKVWKIKNIT